MSDMRPKDPRTKSQVLYIKSLSCVTLQKDDSSILRGVEQAGAVLPVGHGQSHHPPVDHHLPGVHQQDVWRHLQKGTFVWFDRGVKTPIDEKHLWLHRPAAKSFETQSRGRGDEIFIKFPLVEL